MSSIAERLRNLFVTTPPFSALPPEAIEEVLTDLSIEYYRPGEVLMEQGTTMHKGLYIVESGTVRLMDVENQRLIDKCSEGDTFGAFGLMKGGMTIYEAKAVEPTVCALLRGERFQNLFDKYNDFANFYENDAKRYVRHIDKEMDVTGAHLLLDRRLNQFVHRGLVTCAPDTTAQQAARIMRRESVDSILVVHDGKMIGIMTDGDLRNKLVARGQSPDTPVRRLMTTPVLTISTDASLFRAMMIMLNERVNRLVMVQQNDRGATPMGLLTDRDIAHYRGQDPVATTQRIHRAPSISELVSIRAAVSEQLLRLYRQGVQPEMLNSIMSVIYDSLAIRVIELVERDLRQEVPDLRVELPWVWIRLGSGGRQEMALNSQQHNALLYGNPSSPEEAERAEKWFNHLAGRVNEGLAFCGFTMSEYVARDARWRRSLRDWKMTFREWILQSGEEDLRHAGVFFDMRGIYGDKTLIADLKQDIIDALNVQAMDPDRKFLSLLTANALQNKPPLSFLRRFVLQRSGEHRNTFDIRARGILPVVDAARILALEMRNLESSSTFERLRRAADSFPELSRILGDALDAYRHLVDFRLEDQLRAFEAGEPPNNRIDPFVLRKVQQNLLRNVFTQVADLQDAMSKRFAPPNRGRHKS